MSLTDSIGSKVRQSLITPHKKPSIHHTNSQMYVQDDAFHNNNHYTINIPELLCETQTLKEQLKKLRQQNQELSKYKLICKHREEKDITFGWKLSHRPIRREFLSAGLSEGDNSYYNGVEEQKEEEDEESGEFMEEQLRHKQQIIKIQNQSIEVLKGQIHQLQKQLSKERDQKKALYAKVNLGEHKVNLKEKQIMNLEKTVDQYADLMKQQNLKIAELLRERISQGQLSRCASETISQYNMTSNDDKGANIDENKDIENRGHIDYESQFKRYQQKLADYAQIKDDNYRLRNQVAQLSVKNTSLFNLTYRHTPMIDHLWNIKDAEYTHINAQLHQILKDVSQYGQ